MLGAPYCRAIGAQGVAVIGLGAGQGSRIALVDDRKVGIIARPGRTGEVTVGEAICISQLKICTEIISPIIGKLRW